MRISCAWLQELAAVDVDAAIIATQLTMAGLEIEAKIPVAGDFSQVVVAEVVATQPHPNASRLTLCEVSTGVNSTYRIVCGATNVRPMLKVALALPGAHLPNGMIIQETKLRGELSQGMLCSRAELGLEAIGDGILELPADAPVGESLRKYMALDDEVLEINITPNRGDCLSVLGIAREVAALNQQALQTNYNHKITPQIDDVINIQVDTPQVCPRYCGRVVRGINNNASTPLWLQERLLRSGIRTVHPVVDIMNYVMLELGQPMHAFDLSALDGGIVVRYANDSENLTLLDGQEVVLTDKTLIIADANKALAVAGVMGGEASSVTAETQDVFLESAFFNPICIGTTARQYGLYSESSMRFERGVDPALPVMALERASELLQKIVGGTVGPIVCHDDASTLPQLVQIRFDPSLVERLSGVAIAKDNMLTLLTALGMQVVDNGSYWLVHVPSYRFDLSLDVDLVEEILRLYGYDNIQLEPTVASLVIGKENLTEQLATYVTDFFSTKGYLETINYAFVDPKLQEVISPALEALTLLNPISSDLSVMRASLWPGLIASMLYNTRRQQECVKLFELGVVFGKEQGAVHEYPKVAALLTGKAGQLHWAEPSRDLDFYDLKGDLQALFAALKLQNIDFCATQHPALHPGRTAAIMLQQTPIGIIGCLHPQIQDELDLTEDVILMELGLPELINNTPVRYSQISKYPQVRRDLSFLVDKQVTAAQITQVVRISVEPALLKAVDIFDVYHGEGVPAEKKSLAIALILQNDAGTLVDEEINSITTAIINNLIGKFSIILRESP